MRGKSDTFTASEVLLSGLGVLSLLIDCLIVSSKKYFWYDELLTFYLVNDPSLIHMLRALGDRVDTSPPLYYFLAWIWVRFAGASEFSLRLFSSLGICLAYVIAFRVIRRAFGFWSGALGVTASFFLSYQLLWLNSDARCYGLFLALNALALLLYNKWNQKGSQFSWKDFFANALIHGSLVLTHNFGLLYSGIFLLSYFASSFYKKIFTPKAYLSVILGWFAFLPWLTFFLRQAEVGRPHTWMELPNYSRLLNSFTYNVGITFFIIMLFLVSWFLSLKNIKCQEERMQRKEISSPSSSTLLFLAIFLVLIPPLAAYAISKVTIVIFEERHFFPSTLGWSIFFAWLVQNLIPVSEQSAINGEGWRNFFLGNRLRAVLAICLILLLLCPPSYAVIKRSEVRPGQKEEQFCEDLPIVVESALEFLPRFFYSSKKCHFFYLLDWEVALDKDSDLVEVDNYHTMTALRKNYDFDSIMPTETFLKKFNCFMVLNYKGSRWFDLRIKYNNDFHIVNLKNDLIKACHNKN